jgi:hypothetical protein
MGMISDAVGRWGFSKESFNSFHLGHLRSKQGTKSIKT